MMPFGSCLRFRVMRNMLLANEDRRRRRQQQLQRRRSRALARMAHNSFNMPDREFVKTYRLTKLLVRQLIRDIEEGELIQEPQRRDGISIECKVLTALSFYASGSYQTLVGQSAATNVSQTTVSRHMRQVTQALNHPTMFKKYVRWPTNVEERNRIKSKFYHSYSIPGVLGCVDGTHVAIIRPTHHEERFFNRKGYHSLNVMIICDSELNILCVDASKAGSAHDSSVWREHPISRHLEELWNAGEKVFLLGDSGYPLRKNMMTPILNTTEGTPEHNFYTMHVTARNSVERCIGLLKARFRCLLVARTLHYNPITAGKIVNACCLLHNIANQNRVPVTPLTRQEMRQEMDRQQQIQQLSLDAERQVDVRNHRVNPELQLGRELQAALVAKLWRERSLH